MNEQLQQAALRLLRYSFEEITEYSDLTESEQECLTELEYIEIVKLINQLP